MPDPFAAPPQSTPPSPTPRPTRAYTTLFWFLVVGQILTTFTALMAVATLLATARPVVQWQVQVPLPAASPITINPEDVTCATDADCALVTTACGCDCGTAVNRTSLDRYVAHWRARCARQPGPECVLECLTTARCYAGRCDVSLAEQTTDPTPEVVTGINPAAYGPSCGEIVATCNKLVAINCQAEVDGPFYYVNADSGEIVGRCGGECLRPGGCPTPCPPKEWTCK